MIHFWGYACGHLWNDLWCTKKHDNVLWPCKPKLSSQISRLRRKNMIFTWMAPKFSVNWLGLEEPSSTELTPSFLRHQAKESWCKLDNQSYVRKHKELIWIVCLYIFLLTDCQLWQSTAKFLCNMSQFLELCLLFPPIITHYFFPQPLVWLRQKEKDTKYSTGYSNNMN